MECRDIEAKRREIAKAGGTAMTRNQTVRWFREFRFNKRQIPASAGAGANKDDLMGLGGQVKYVKHFHHGDIPSALAIRMRHDAIQDFHKRRTAVVMPALTYYAMRRKGQPPDFSGINPWFNEDQTRTTHIGELMAEGVRILWGAQTLRLLPL